MKVFLILGTVCATFLGGQGVPVPIFTGASSVSFVQPGVQYSTFVQHHPLVHFQPVQTNFVQVHFQPLLHHPLGYPYPPLLFVQPVQLAPSNGTGEEPKPGNVTGSQEIVKSGAPSHDYPEAVQTEVDAGSDPAVLPLMKPLDSDLDDVEKDGKTRAELEANDEEKGDTVAVDSTGTENDAEDE